jgi:dTMP kinase
MPFIVFEGPDGTGKTSSAQSLYTHLAPRYPTILTKEPGGTPLGDDLRGLMLRYECTPLTELLLMSAARVEHIRTTIAPALQQGRLVLCDRYVDSTYVYQGYIKGLDCADIAMVQKLINPPLPDLVFFFSHKYRTDIADRLEDLDQKRVLDGYYTRQHHATIPWVVVPRSDPNTILKFMLQHVQKFLIHAP